MVLFMFILDDVTNHKHGLFHFVLCLNLQFIKSYIVYGFEKYDQNTKYFQITYDIFRGYNEYIAGFQLQHATSNMLLNFNTFHILPEISQNIPCTT